MISMVCVRHIKNKIDDRMIVRITIRAPQESFDHYNYLRTTPIFGPFAPVVGPPPFQESAWFPVGPLYAPWTHYGMASTAVRTWPGGNLIANWNVFNCWLILVPAPALSRCTILYKRGGLTKYDEDTFFLFEANVSVRSNTVRFNAKTGAAGFYHVTVEITRTGLPRAGPLPNSADSGRVILLPGP